MNKPQIQSKPHYQVFISQIKLFFRFILFSWSLLMQFLVFHSLAIRLVLLSPILGDVGTRIHRHGELLGTWKVRVLQKLSVPTKPERVERAAFLHKIQPSTLGLGGSANCKSLMLFVQPVMLAESKCEPVPHERVAFSSHLHNGQEFAQGAQ